MFSLPWTLESLFGLGYARLLPDGLLTLRLLVFDALPVITVKLFGAPHTRPGPHTPPLA